MLHQNGRFFVPRSSSKARPDLALTLGLGILVGGLSACPVAAQDGAPSETTTPATAPAASQDSAAPQVDVGPPPRIEDTSAMDPELVKLINERIAAVEAAPSSIEARTALGFAYEANTIWSLADIVYGQATELAPDDPQWRFRRGIVRFKVGNIDGSIEDLKAAADKYKNTPVVQARYGNIMRFVGELEISEAAWRQAIAAEANQPQNVEYAPSRVGLAQVLLDLDEPVEAEALCRRAIELNPGYKEAHYTLGLSLQAQGRDAEATPELVLGETAFQMFPPDPHQGQLSNSTRGFSRRMMIVENLIQAGNLPEAKTRLDAIELERPEDHMVLNLGARVALRGGDLPGARAKLERSLEVAPGQPGTLMEACLLELQQSEQTINQLGQMQMAQQQGQPIDMAQFDALRTQGAAQATSAVDYATKAVQSAPAVGRHHFWLGMSQLTGARFATEAQAQQQQMQAALTSMQNAGKLGCVEPSFNQQISMLYKQMGRAREMLDHAMRHLSANPVDPFALQLAIEAQISAGKPEQIQPYVERLQAAAPNDPNSLQFVVKAYLTIKDLEATEASLSAFEAAAAGNPQAAAFITAVQAEIERQRAEVPAAGPPAPPKEPAKAPEKAPAKKAGDQTGGGDA